MKRTLSTDRIYSMETQLQSIIYRRNSREAAPTKPGEGTEQAGVNMCRSKLGTRNRIVEFKWAK